MANKPIPGFDDLDWQHREEEAARELEQLKRQMAFNETVFVRDIPLSAEQKARGHVSIHLLDIEEMLQKFNESFHMVSHPAMNAAVRAVREAISQTPELASYVAAALSREKASIRSGRDLQRVLGEIEKKSRAYHRKLNSLSGVGMHGKLVELGSTRGRIVKILEELPDPLKQQTAQVRYRINVATGNPEIIRPQQAGPESGEHLNARIFKILKAYLPKLDGFITYLAENPDANRIDHIGYDMGEYAKILDLVGKIEVKNRK
jgi:hypothetical protein